MEQHKKYYCPDGRKHTFAGGKCVNCQANQQHVSMSRVQREKVEETKEKKGIHKHFQEVARMMWEYYGGSESGETFGVFIGKLKQWGGGDPEQGVERGYQMLSKMKEYERDNGEKFPIKILMTE